MMIIKQVSILDSLIVMTNGSVIVNNNKIQHVFVWIEAEQRRNNLLDVKVSYSNFIYY
jgi:hypothetical protein